MNKQVIVGALVAVLFIGGGAWYVMQDTAQLATEEGNQQRDAQRASDETLKGSGSLSSLAMRGGSYKCTVAMNEQGAVSSGTVYISGQKMHGEFQSSVQGRNVTNTFISDGEYMYTWSDMMAQGFKMALNAQASSGTSQQGSFDTDKNVDYDCAPWSADASYFVPPSNVEFMTPGAMPGLPAGMNIPGYSN